MGSAMTISEAKQRIERLEKLKNQSSTSASTKVMVDKRIKDLQSWIAKHS